MFIAKNNDLIILAKNTREELEQALQFMVYTDIEETDKNYILYNGSYVTEEEILLDVKQKKYDEALQKANEYQQNGSVEYKNCVFEMSDSNRKNLSDTEEALKLMGETETTWLDKDDNYVVLSVEDIQYIRLNLILAEIQKLWITKYPYYKELITNASTIEEVNAIEIDYTQDIPEPTPEPTEEPEA